MIFTSPKAFIPEVQKGEIGIRHKESLGMRTIPISLLGQNLEFGKGMKNQSIKHLHQWNLYMAGVGEAAIYKVQPT